MSSNQPCSPASYRLLYAVVGLNNDPCYNIAKIAVLAKARPLFDWENFMNNMNADKPSKQEYSTETEIALLKQSMQGIVEQITRGFDDLKGEMRNYSTKSELQLAIQERDTKIGTVSNELRTLAEDYSEYKASATRRTNSQTLISTIAAVVVTFLLTYFLNDVVRKGGL